jgi:hypothetical protein
MRDTIGDALTALRAGGKPDCPGCGSPPSEWTTANCFLWECNSGAQRRWVREGEFTLANDAIRYSPECYALQLSEKAERIRALEACVRELRKALTYDGQICADSLSQRPLAISYELVPETPEVRHGETKEGTRDRSPVRERARETRL